MAKKSGAGGIIVLALVLGVVTAVLLGSYLRTQADKEKKNWQPVIVAAVDIGARTKITREPEEVMDRFTKDAIRAKSQLRKSDLLAEGQASTLALKVHEGMRAVAISIDEVRGVGTAIQPGDHVDIIATFQDQRTRQVITR
jgi:pilus assembly protein CpaB